MTKFEPIIKNPGDLIRSEEWNKMQEEIRTDLDELNEKIGKLKEYVENMLYSVTLTDAKSSLGISYNLDGSVPGESDNYGTSIVGNITKQWCLGKGNTGKICRFGIIDFMDMLYYWSGAGEGDKKTLKIMIEYVDGDVYNTDDLFIHKWSELRPKGGENAYIEYLLSPNERVWYKYMLKNPKPDKEVRYIYFENTNSGCTPRIGNVVQYLTKIRQMRLL
ncbi:MAG: hypothetical protein QMD06_00365 [Candidatus Altarchaeum sp.]|nr:hypothetical protein [Candidatus Altarchaeum sp.]